MRKRFATHAGGRYSWTIRDLSCRPPCHFLDVKPLRYDRLHNTVFCPTQPRSVRVRIMRCGIRYVGLVLCRVCSLHPKGNLLTTTARVKKSHTPQPFDRRPPTPPFVPSLCSPGHARLTRHASGDDDDIAPVQCCGHLLRPLVAFHLLFHDFRIQRISTSVRLHLEIWIGGSVTSLKKASIAALLLTFREYAGGLASFIIDYSRKAQCCSDIYTSYRVTKPIIVSYRCHMPIHLSVPAAAG